MRQLDVLNRRNVALQQQFYELSQQTLSLLTASKGWQEDILHLEQQLVHLREKISRVLRDNLQLQQTNFQLQQTTAGLRTEIEELERSIGQLEELLAAERRVSAANVAAETREPNRSPLGASASYFFRSASASVPAEATGSTQGESATVINTRAKRSKVREATLLSRVSPPTTTPSHS